MTQKSHGRFSLPTTLITVDNFTLLIQLFSHHGLPMSAAHYTSIIKHDDKFIRYCGSSSTIERRPRGGNDVYIIIMELLNNN